MSQPHRNPGYVSPILEEVVDARIIGARKRADDRRPLRHKTEVKIPGSDHICLSGTEHAQADTIKAQHVAEEARQKAERERLRAQKKAQRGRGGARGRGRGRGKLYFCGQKLYLYFSWTISQCVSKLSPHADIGTSQVPCRLHGCTDVPTSASGDKWETLWENVQEKYKLISLAQNPKFCMFSSTLR